MNCEDVIHRLSKTKWVYQPILAVPKFSDQEKVENFQRRLDVVIEYCHPAGKTFVDLGCNFGFNSFGLARAGGTVTGVDRGPMMIDACRCLGEMYGFAPDNPEFIDADIVAYAETMPHVDYVIMLNTFHHIMKQHRKDAWITLTNIARKCDIIVMSMPHKGKIPKLVRKHTELTHLENLGATGGAKNMERELHVFRGIR